MCVLQCSAHTYYKKKAILRRGLFLYTPHCSAEEQDGQIQTAGPTLTVHKGAHAQTLASTQVCSSLHPPFPPPSPRISVRSICSACAAKSFCFILTESSEQTCPVCAAGLTPDMQMHLISATVLKIELHACACDVGVHVCRNNLVPLCLAEQQRRFLFLPHS